MVWLSRWWWSCKLKYVALSSFNVFVCWVFFFLSFSCLNIARLGCSSCCTCSFYFILVRPQVYRICLWLNSTNPIWLDLRIKTESLPADGEIWTRDPRSLHLCAAAHRYCTRSLIFSITIFSKKSVLYILVISKMDFLLQSIYIGSPSNALIVYI